MSKRAVLTNMLIILVIISFAPLTAFAQQVKVPSIVNMDAAQAKQKLESVGSLRFTVSDSTFTYDQKRDRKVASQNPAAGQIVQRGSVVNVSLYFYTAPVTVPNIVNMSITQAANTLQSLGLTYKGVGRDTPTTEQSKNAKVAAQNPAAGQIVPKLSAVNVTIYQYQPPTAGVSNMVTVPNIVSMDPAQARKTLEGVGLKYRQSISVLATEQSNHGKVAGQVPPAGQSVQRGSDVTVATYQFQPLVTVPNIVSMRMAQAEKTLEGLGLNSVQGNLIFTTEQSRNGTVCKQDPPAGQTIRKGSALTIYLCGYQLVAVPDVLSRDQTQAIQALERVGLKYQPVGNSSTTEQGRHGKVASQNPSGGQKAPRGALINITVYQYQPSPVTLRNVVTVPNIVSMDQARALKTIENAGLKYQSVGTVQPTERSQGWGTVASQSPRAGQTAPRGSAVNVYIYNAPSHGDKDASLVTVPDIVNMNSQQAANTLQSVGLKYQAIPAYKITIQSENGRVVRQDPLKGQALPRGGVVNGYTYQYQPLAAAVSNLVTVPNIVSMDQAQAIRTLENGGFKYQSAGTIATTEQSKQGKVASQNPPARQNVQKGSAVNVYLYQYKK